MCVCVCVCVIMRQVNVIKLLNKNVSELYIDV